VVVRGGWWLWWASVELKRWIRGEKISIAGGR
jgi:hypothetical protein